MCVCLCVYTCTHMWTHVLLMLSNLKFVLSFDHLGPGSWTQVISVGGMHRYVLNYLTGPHLKNILICLKLSSIFYTCYILPSFPLCRPGRLWSAGIQIGAITSDLYVILLIGCLVVDLSLFFFLISAGTWNSGVTYNWQYFQFNKM